MKNFRLMIVFAIVAAFIVCGSVALANDTWVYTDNYGAEYYLRGRDGGASWAGARVVKVQGNEVTPLLYRFEDIRGVLYSISYGESFVHPGATIKKGSLYRDSNPDPVAMLLWEKYLSNSNYGRGAPMWNR